MSWKGKAVNLLNGIIAPAGLTLERKSKDFDARLTSDKHVAQFHRLMTDAFSNWLSRQHVMLRPVDFDIYTHISEFYRIYLNSPFRDIQGGSRYNNALWLSLLARAIQPTVVVDSGTYKGASAWALSLGAPSARLFSFDLDLSHVRQRQPNCTYVERDWTTYRGVELSEGDSGLCYFDDHLDQARRLIEAQSRGFQYAIFDDDYNVTSFALMARDTSALPKIEFILDDELVDEEVITWVYGSTSYFWKANRAYLNQAKAAIEETERLPNTSLISGIHQTPYRIVRLKTKRKAE